MVGTYLFDLGHDRISLLLRPHVRSLNLLHAPDVLAKVSRQDGVDWGVVHGDDVLDQVWRAQGQDHGCLGAPFPPDVSTGRVSLKQRDGKSRERGEGRKEEFVSHRVAYDGGVVDLVLFHEGTNVLGHGRIVMARGMGGIAMVSEILCQHVSIMVFNRGWPDF